VKSSAKPGAVIKAIRLKNKWTLADVSERTGITVSTLSKVENDKVSLNYEKLTLISKGMDVDIGMLFAPPGNLRNATQATGRKSVTKAGEGVTIDTPTYGYTYTATDLLKKHFVPMIGELRAHSMEEFGEFIHHDGEEYAYVLEGCVDFHSELYAPIRLNVGDSIYFDSGMGHAYIAASDGRCRVLSICSGEESQIGSALAAKRAEKRPNDGRVAEKASAARSPPRRKKRMKSG